MGAEKLSANNVYEVTCSECEHVMQTQPSLFMELGVNYGSITCSQCLTFLHVQLHPGLSGKIMVSQPYSAFAAKKRNEIDVAPNIDADAIERDSENVGRSGARRH